MTRALITGITGQDGLYLGELLSAKGYEVVGLVRDFENPRLAEVRSAVPGVALLQGDVCDAGSLAAAFEAAQPDEVYNLGAISFVGDSWQNAARVSEVSGLGALNVLEASRRYSPSARVLQASSSEIFGRVREVPQTELTLPWPRSPYGVAKVFAHYSTISHRESYNMHASSAILFNHESPRRGPEFVTRKVARAVARISLGLQDTLLLGNLDSRRDWGFAGDYVEAMWLMLQQDVADDYVIATGETHSIRELLDAAFARVGIAEWQGHVTQDERFMRPAEGGQLVGDASKAREALGWQPRVGFEQLVEMMVDADLELARAE